MWALTIEIHESSVNVEVPHEYAEDGMDPDSVERALIDLGFEHAFHTHTSDMGDDTFIYHFTT